MAIVYILVGIAGGLIGGMGMGGGTLLIPLLTIFCGAEQHIAQSVNLIAFIPMSVVAIIIHIKNRLIRGEYFQWTALPATAVAVLASLLVRNMGGDQLQKYFGLFLIALGIYQFVCAVKQIRNERSQGYMPEEEIQGDH